MENLNKIPTVLHPDGLPRVGNCKVESWLDKLERFVNEHALQGFCNHPENSVHNGMLMQICCCRENEYYSLSFGEDVQDVSSDDEILNDFRINVGRCEGLRLYKVGKLLGRPTCGAEIQAFHTATFWVTCENGYWNAEEILPDDGQLFVDKVRKAFRRIAELKGLILSKAKPQMSSIRLAIQGTAAFETKAWAQKFVTPEGEEKTLLCLMDNGRIVEASSEELPLCEVCSDTVLRTKFNLFYWNGVMYDRSKK